MKTTPEEVDLAKNVLVEAIPGLIADLEEATSARGSGVLVPSPKLKEMQA